METSIIKQILSVAITKFSTLFFSMIGVVLIARGLGVETRGLYASILVVPTLLVALFEGGMRQASINYIGQKKRTLDEVLSSLMVYNFISSLIGLFFCIFVMMYWNVSDIDMIIVASFIVPVMLVLNSYKGVFIGLQEIKKYNNSIWFSKLITTCLIVVLYLNDALDLKILICLALLNELISLLQATYYSRSLHKFNFTYVNKVTIDMFKMGMLYSLAFFLIQANYKIDILMISKLSTLKETGIYSVSSQIGDIIWQIPAAVVVVLLSRIASQRKGSEESIQMICYTTRVTLFVTFLVTICAIITSYPLIPVLFGEDYEQVSNTLLYLSPGLIFAVIFKTVNSYYAAQGKPFIAIKVMLVCVVINIISNFLLIPSFGAIGASVSSSICYIISAVIIISIFCREFDVSICDMLIVRRQDVRKSR